MSIGPGTGLISGIPTATGSFVATVTATDTTGASGSASFFINVASPVTLNSPGPQASYLGQPVVAQFTASDVVAGRNATTRRILRNQHSPDTSP